MLVGRTVLSSASRNTSAVTPDALPRRRPRASPAADDAGRPKRRQCRSPSHECPPGRPHPPRRQRRRSRSDAARAPRIAGGQPLPGRRPGVGRVRHARRRLRDLRRLHHLPGVHHVRRLAQRRRDRGARRDPAVRDRAVLPAGRQATAGRRARVLRPLRRTPEWPQMEAGNAGDTFNPWTLSMLETVQGSKPTSAIEQNAFSKWLDQTTDREEGRRDRRHGAEGIIPTSVWLVLFLLAVVAFTFMLFFADSGEGPGTQAVLMGSVATVIVVTLLAIHALDSPFHKGTGQIQPIAMQRTLRLLDQARAAVGDRAPVPCDARG